jgi:hypothetical protein
MGYIEFIDELLKKRCSSLVNKKLMIMAQPNGKNM